MGKLFDAEKDGKNVVENKKDKSKTPLLDYYGRDLTKLASEDKLDPVFGREKEIQEIVHVLNKRKKNNPLLIGEPGVGKTAVVEGLVIKIFKGDVEMWLLDKRVIEINMTSMVSGTKYRGEFEQRMEDLLKEIEENPNVIIFLDEIHNVVGAGGASGAMDAANIIKPALSRGAIKCIGATTTDEYKKHIEDEGAFERRFQKIYVGEPTLEETETLLNSIKSKYEDYHNVEYSDSIIKSCVDLADKYITYRKFPDKAIDLMDEVGSKVKGKNSCKPKVFEDLGKLLDFYVSEKKKASETQSFEKAAKYRDEERNVLKKIEEEKIKWETDLRKNKVKVEIEDVAYIISSHTGIPTNKLTDSENKKLLSLSDALRQRIIGQNEALQKIEDTIQRSRLGIQDPFRPLASFLFLGPTGVGKTLMAKLLASHLFNTNDSFIRIDMSEYDEKHSISKLIGSPPGYIGHEDKGQLTEKIKTRPYSLILFDEVEKAHPDVFNLFLQILDEGKLTDSKGAEVNFKNTIIIMTSNIGTRNILEENQIGFNAHTDKVKNNKSLVFKELEKHFKPEFLNRIDEKIVFNPLEKVQIESIAKIEVDDVLSRINKKGYLIDADNDVILKLAEIGYDKKYGARPIKRTIQEKIGNLISKSILKEEIIPEQKYILKLEGEDIKIEIVKKSKKNDKNKGE